MRPHNLHQLGDEPLYCEAQHDDGTVLSGSDDDYYEASEHRRIRIEAKALQFLNGEVPYLLSARLRGPFDAKSWQNPWKSSRAQRQAAPRRASRNGRSQTRVEAARTRGSGQLSSDDLPDTQGTSLYPLPSPEATNPPSARKSSFIDEDDYSRIKSWRESVKSVPLPSDPFWAPSSRERGHGPSKTRKRMADKDLLQKRSYKRCRPELPTRSPEESPSQTTARARRILTNQNSGLTTQSAPGPLTCENELDELAAPRVTQVSSFDAPRLAYGTTGTPVFSRPARGSPSSRWRLHCLDPDMSEDELSMPSTTPSRKTSQHSAERGRGSTCRSPSSKQKPFGRVLSSSIHKDITGGKTRAEHVQNSQPSSPGQRLGLQRARRLAKDAARKLTVSSQQDDSFHFHHARPTSPVQQSDKQHPRVSETGAAGLNQRPLRVQTTVAQTKCPPSTDRRNDHAKEDLDSVPSHLDNQPLLDTCSQQATTSETVENSKMVDQAGAVAVADMSIEKEAAAERMPPVLGEKDPVVQDRENEDSEAMRQEAVGTDESCIKSKVEEPAFVCTQELSPISICGKNAHASSVWPNAPVEGTAPHSNPRRISDGSDSEWSTSDNPQNLSAKSIRTLSTSSDADEASNREWSTYINTQDLSALPEQPLSNRSTNDKVVVVLQGPDDTKDPDWTTFINTQDLTITSAAGRENMSQEQAQEVESISEWSTYMSASLQTNADEMGDVTVGPVLENPATMLDTKPSEANVGDTIVVCTDQEPPVEEIVEEQARHDLVEGRITDTMAISCDEETAQPVAESREQQNVVLAEHLTDDPPSSPASVPQIEYPSQATSQPQGAGDSSLMNLDGTTASLDPMKGQSPWSKETSNILKVAMYPENGVGAALPRVVDMTSASIEPQQLQSPWQMDGNLILGTTTAPPDNLATFDGNALDMESRKPPNFWAQAKEDMPMPDTLDNESTLNEVKTRTSAKASILRGPASCSRLLFEAPTAPKAKRRVTFAPLPGESSPKEVTSKEDSEICVEDVSYFDARGKKTASIRVTKPTSRAASPPPSNLNITEADDFPDHDHKFSKHFAVMSKRKKQPPRRSLRLLPSDSQQTSDSQEAAAMAEAFIEASQTRKDVPELAEVPDRNIVQQIGSPADKNRCYPMGQSLCERLENIEPTDDVSAVLDNIDDFLDNTWGVNTSMDIDTDQKDQVPSHSQTAKGRVDNIGDPMLAMNINVWADSN
ncbi:hypothetical protein M406DRAFT_329896 [Cryphonectria parasitica EP155]|uniref:Protamine P1 n=1 Tax=Cryphonectria parasitica (strain ATCC 38755 / EP155) TaxID=660469 RepID=A0A9P5CPD6_CRYP1|nr:uncharacterized protein M406DRAFT_329896 [Cryphonectria parasitica EP155]KAF3766053.1 hypothetical protein M406DRAFT_329896 [Cryphonectria parasitica EP155]